jgi:hypothetical protein
MLHGISAGTVQSKTSVRFRASNFPQQLPKVSFEDLISDDQRPERPANFATARHQWKPHHNFKMILKCEFVRIDFPTVENIPDNSIGTVKHLVPQEWLREFGRGGIENPSLLKVIWFLTMTTLFDTGEVNLGSRLLGDGRPLFVTSVAFFVNVRGPRGRRKVRVPYWLRSRRSTSMRRVAGCGIDCSPRTAYRTPRGLDRGLLTMLVEGSWIEDKKIIICVETRKRCDMMKIVICERAPKSVSILRRQGYEFYADTRVNSIFVRK